MSSKKQKLNSLVSVILPTYNRAHLIGRAIKSVLEQTYQNLEPIVVDDASRDETEKVVNSFNNKRIRYLRLKRNSGGSSKPRNAGIKASKGKYIAFLDSDDQWLPEKLGKQLAVLREKPDSGLVYSRFYKIKNGKKTLSVWPEIKKKERWIHKQLLIGNFITTSTVLIRKETLKKVTLFDENLFGYQDWEFFLRLSKETKFAFIDKPLVIQYQNLKNRISADKNKLTQAAGYILEKHKEDIEKDRKIYARFLSMANHKFKAWLLEPWNLRYLKEFICKMR